MNLTDLPRPFIRALLDALDPDDGRSLLFASASILKALSEVKPVALVRWGSTAAGPTLEQLLSSSVVGALLVPDSCNDFELSPELHLDGLKTAVLSYRLPKLARSLSTSAHAASLNSIIIRGWVLDPHFGQHLATFLQHLQDVGPLRNLVLTLPCTPPAAAAALGKLTQLKSLRMCIDVCHSSELMLRQDTDVTWTAECWQAGIQPLGNLTSLHLQLPLVLAAGADLQLESLSGLNRLELVLDEPKTPGDAAEPPVGAAGGGARAANLLLQQPGLPSLQHLTRLVLSTTYRHNSYAFAGWPEELMHHMPPEDTMEILAQLTSLQSLTVTPHEWRFSLQQLQPLSACSRLTELVLAQLGMGFAGDVRHIDRHGTQLSTQEKAVVQAALAATAALHAEQQGGSAGRSAAAAPGGTVGTIGVGTTPSTPGAAAVVGSPSQGVGSGAAATGGADSSVEGSAATPAGGKYPRSVAMGTQQVQMPLLPELRVLHVTSLWWRLPLCVVSGKLEDVAYKRLNCTDYGSFVMNDLQMAAQEDEADFLPAFPGPLPFAGLAQQPDLPGGPGPLPVFNALQMNAMQGLQNLQGLFQPLLAQQDMPAVQGALGQWQVAQMVHQAQQVAQPHVPQLQQLQQLLQQQQPQQQPQLQPHHPHAFNIEVALGPPAAAHALQEQQQQQQPQAHAHPHPHAFNMEGDVGPLTEAQVLQQQQQQQQQQGPQAVDVSDEVFEEMLLAQDMIMQDWQDPPVDAHPHPHVFDMEGDLGPPTEAHFLQAQQAQQQAQLLLQQHQQQNQQQGQQGQGQGQNQQQNQQQGQQGQGQGVHHALQTLLQQVQVLQQQVHDLQDQQQQQQHLQQPGGGGEGGEASDTVMGEASAAPGAPQADTAAAVAAAGGGGGGGGASSSQAVSTAAAGAPPVAAAAAEDGVMDLDSASAVVAADGGISSPAPAAASSQAAAAAAGSLLDADVEENVPMLLDHPVAPGGGDGGSSSVAGASLEQGGVPAVAGLPVTPDLVTGSEGADSDHPPGLGSAEASDDDIDDLPELLLVQQPPAAPAAAAAAAAAVPAAPAPTPLADAPVDKVYADVLRGLKSLTKLDVDVTGLCKVMQLTSSPLAGVRELRIHMLGAVHLPPGGLPTLPSLTHLEFYLPDERNWEADYNDYEDLPLWRHQANVRQLVLRGTFHAGGFFAPGHLDLAHQAMPHISRLVFMKCGDLKPERLQEVVDSRLSPYIEVVEGRNFGLPHKPGQQPDPAAAGATVQQALGQQQQQQLGQAGAAGTSAAAAAGPEGGSEAAEQQEGDDDLPPLLQAVVVSNGLQQLQQQEGQGVAASTGEAGGDGDGPGGAAGFAIVGGGGEAGGAVGVANAGGGGEGGAAVGGGSVGVGGGDAAPDLLDMEDQSLQMAASPPTAQNTSDVPELLSEGSEDSDSDASSEDIPGLGIGIGNQFEGHGAVEGAAGGVEEVAAPVVLQQPSLAWQAMTQALQDGAEPWQMMEAQQSLQQQRGRFLQALKVKRRAGLEAVAARAGEVGVAVKLLPVVAWVHWYHEMLE